MPARIASLIACVLLAVAVAGCSQTTPRNTTDGTSPVGTPVASPASPQALPTLSPTSVVADSNCSNDPKARIVTLVVTTDDATAPVQISYAAFQQDGSPVVHTVTVHGPVITMQERFCGDGTAEQRRPWTFSASTLEMGDLSCAVFWGGRLMQSAQDTTADSDKAANLTADCSSHSGM